MKNGPASKFIKQELAESTHFVVRDERFCRRA
jgi:hypothetical protein